MPARRADPGARGTDAGGPPARPRVLIVAGAARGDLLARRLAPLPCECVLAASASAAREALAAHPFDAALIAAEVPGGSGLDLAREVAHADGGLAVIVVADRPTLEQAVQAMRSGAADLVDIAESGPDLAGLGERVRAAMERTRRVREMDERIERLRRVCRRLSRARREVTRQVGALCNDLVGAYQELSDKVTHMDVATEFSSLIRQELDVESLLRTALEFILAKTGPTNAAVYLPATSSDFSLGAYVNYDLPKDTSDILLEHLAGVVAPRLEREPGLRWLGTPESLEEFLGADAHWLADAAAVAFACRHEDECLAVVILFRDRATPFAEDLRRVLRTVADLFGRQLARVIHIHHRHLPRDQWGGFASEGDDDLDLAA